MNLGVSSSKALEECRLFAIFDKRLNHMCVVTFKLVMAGFEPHLTPEQRMQIREKHLKDVLELELIYLTFMIPLRGGNESDLACINQLKSYKFEEDQMKSASQGVHDELREMRKVEKKKERTAFKELLSHEPPRRSPRLL